MAPVELHQGVGEQVAVLGQESLTRSHLVHCPVQLQQKSKYRQADLCRRGELVGAQSVSGADALQTGADPSQQFQLHSRPSLTGYAGSAWLWWSGRPPPRSPGRSSRHTTPTAQCSAVQLSKHYRVVPGVLLGLDRQEQQQGGEQWQGSAHGGAGS